MSHESMNRWPETSESDWCGDFECILEPSTPEAFDHAMGEYAKEMNRTESEEANGE
jgi:hypothetical protein